MQERSKPKQRTIVSEAANHLAEILSRVPFVELAEVQSEPAKGDAACDLLFSVLKGKKRSRLVVEVKLHQNMMFLADL